MSDYAQEVDAELLTRLLTLVKSEKLVQAILLSYELPDTLGSELRVAVTELLAGESIGKRRGLFIVVTGIDKTGKETQCFNPTNLPIRSIYSLLVEQGFNVLPIRQPNYNTSTGRLILSLLKRSGPYKLGSLSPGVGWVLWSLNRALDNIVVKGWLCHGDKNVVLAKRWTESNVAYHSAMGVNTNEILGLEARIEKPDLTIVLDAPPNVVLPRLDRRGDLFEDVDLLNKVYSNFKNLGRLYPYGSLKFVDATGELDSVNKNLIKAVMSFLDNTRG